MEACNCCSERRETRTQIGQRGKTENRIRVIKSENPLVFFAKTENQMLKDRKSTNHNEHQNRKTKVFKQKKRKTDLKKSQNRKTKNPNAPLLFLRDWSCLWWYCVGRHVGRIRFFTFTQWAPCLNYVYLKKKFQTEYPVHLSFPKALLILFHDQWWVLQWEVKYLRVKEAARD